MSRTRAYNDVVNHRKHRVRPFRTRYEGSCTVCRGLYILWGRTIGYLYLIKSGNVNTVANSLSRNLI
jgi:hypothetical protein